MDVDVKKIGKRAKKFSEAFMTFATRGNMVDLAVGMIIGSAFTGIVNSLVNDIVMPLLSPLTGHLDFSSLFIAMDGKTYASLEEATSAGVAMFKYGNFITLVINFFIVAFCIFLMVRWITAIREAADKKKAAESAAEEAAKEAEKVAAPPAAKTCPFCITQIDIAASRCPNCTSALDE